MKKKYCLLFLFVITIIISGCAMINHNSGYEKEKQTNDIQFEYPPLVYVNDALYCTSGTGEYYTVLPNGCEKLGTIIKRCSSVEPLPEENFYSNCFDEDTEVYYDSNNSDIIYLSVVFDSELRYVCFERTK